VSFCDVIACQVGVRGEVVRERIMYAIPRAYARGGLGLKNPLDLDILQKLYYLRKGA